MKISAAALQNVRRTDAIGHKLSFVFAVAWSFEWLRCSGQRTFMKAPRRVNAAAPGLRVVQKSQIEGCKHQDNADVRHQPFPEPVPEEQQIYANDNGYQHHNVKHDGHVPCHLNHQFKYVNRRLPWSCRIYLQAPN
ncbi:hypothetical protein [Paraburkholderia sp. MM5482-R1]|uniref:hypothetical protein n=1 Tax=unclassified Paraburkholderia TaxID=2615204 RepID=UPI003D1FB9AD